MKDSQLLALQLVVGAWLAWMGSSGILQGEETSVSRSYSTGGLTLRFDNPGDNDRFKVYSSTGGKTRLSYSPSAGLGNRYDNHKVRLSPGQDGGEMIAEFHRGTSHGGFSIHSENERVQIIAQRSGATAIEKRAGWAHPTVTIEKDGIVFSGNLVLRVEGTNVKINDRATTRRGATPLTVVILGLSHQFTFRRDGTVYAYKRSDFPAPGEVVR